MTGVPPARIATLDGLRGVAVMGILLMNVNAFAMPFAAYDNPAAYGAMRPVDVALWAAELVVIDGKIRAIFSALFGASLLLVAERAAAAGRSAARVHYARMATLLLFGLAHACLVWAGDILVLYALVGCVAFLFRRLPVEKLLAAAATAFLFGLAVAALHYAALALLRDAALRPGAAPVDVATWRAVFDGIGPPRARVLGADLALHRGPWAPLARNLAAGEWASLPQQLLLDGPETLGLMLAGMAGLRTGLLTGAWPRRARRRLVLAGGAFGLPIMLVIGAVLSRDRFPPLETALLTDLAAAPARWALALAETALLVRWLARPSPLKRRLAAAGRAAFTNYLGTSLLMAAIFDGWGLGLYGRVGRAELLLFVFADWALILLWSKPWLDRFAYGPLEWLWRALARGELPAMRRTAIASASHSP